MGRSITFLLFPPSPYTHTPHTHKHPHPHTHTHPHTFTHTNTHTHTHTHTHKHPHTPTHAHTHTHTHKHPHTHFQHTDGWNDWLEQWVAYDNWVYTRTFVLTKDQINGMTVWLKCDGLDTAANIRYVWGVTVSYCRAQSRSSWLPSLNVNCICTNHHVTSSLQLETLSDVCTGMCIPQCEWDDDGPR